MQVVDSIQPDEEKLLDTTLGHHTVVVKPWLGASTQTIEFNLARGDYILLECGWLPSDVKGITKFVIAEFVLVAVVFFISIAATKFPVTDITSYIVGVLIALFVAIFLSVLVFSLIGLFKPGWIFYLKESK